MALVELDADPLVATDPLDCGKEDDNISENVQENWIKFEPDMHLDEPANYSSTDLQIGHRLRTRKHPVINISDVEDDSDYEWNPTVLNQENKKRKQQLLRKHNSRRESATDSDEENTMPSNRKKLRKKIRKFYFPNQNEIKRRGKFSCKVCRKTFINATLLNKHVSNFCQSFSCEDCLIVFSDFKGLLKHSRTAHDKEEHSNGVESGKISDREESSNYVEANNQIEKNERCNRYYEQLKTERKYQCEVCQKTFITSGHLNTHMYRHSDKKWTCNGCGKNFSCERSLIRHKDTFPGEHWFPCKYCDTTFFRISNIAKHMIIKHPEALNEDQRSQNLGFNLEAENSIPAGISNSVTSIDSKNFFDGKCLKSFSSSEMVIAHNKTEHSVLGNELNATRHEEQKEKDGEGKKGSEDNSSNCETNYKCEICFKGFISLEGFEYHRNHQHVDKEVKKKKKKKMFSIYNEGVEERNDESLSTNFKCKICSAQFVLKSTLQSHLKTHNVTKNMEFKAGSHQCCICPRSFTSSDGLKYHLATHTGERRYSCSQCGKRFIKKTHLSEHIATHSEVKYFKCPRCPRAFSTHSAYRKHIKHFPGPHSFPCSKCGKLFTKESMIEKHMCVDLVKITMAPEVKALLSEDMIEEYLCLAEEQMAEELARKSDRNSNREASTKQGDSLLKDEQKWNASHSCYKCFKIFPSLSALQVHQNDHIGKQNYQCRFCPESFTRADAFGAHIRNHLGNTPYMCLKCNRKFISPFTLSMHAKNYPGDHSFTCKKCQRWFPSEQRLEKHECILQNSDCFKCACALTFQSWNELLQHAGTKPYKCCSCEFKYPTLMALARHIKKHTGVKPFACEVCGKSFRAKSNYLNHKNIHAETKEIKCDHCNYKSKSQKRMDFHLYRKHDIGLNTGKSTLCPMCGMIFPYVSHMKKHMELEHGNELILEEATGEKKSLSPELCTLCGKLLNNKYTLANHMKKVHDPSVSKKDRTIKCEFCDEKFHTLKRLQRHAEIHEIPGLRICEICHKEFYFGRELRKHMRKHDTNKPFSCPRCGKHFKVSVSLKYHSTICGGVTQRNLNSRRKKEVKEPGLDILFGHIDPIDLNNQQCMVQIYGR